MMKKEAHRNVSSERDAKRRRCFPKRNLALDLGVIGVRQQVLMSTDRVIERGLNY